MTDKEKIDEAVDLILDCAQIDGAHHKTWVLDQVLRILVGDQYDSYIKDYCGDDPEDEDNYYDWDTGIAP